MNRTLLSRFSLWRDSAGTGALELALALPVLLLLMTGMIDMSRVISARIDMEQAAIRATDYALAIRPTSSNSSYIRNEAATAAGVPVKDVTVEIFLECDGVRQANFNSVCASGEDQARLVSVEIVRTVDSAVDWTSIAGLFGKNAGDSDITVTGNSVVRFQ